MNDYIQINAKLSPVSLNGEAGDALSLADGADLLAAMLAQIGFESFENDGDSLRAFAPKKHFDREALRQLIADFPFGHLIHIDISDVTEIEGEDWNSEWEKNYFKPYVFGENKCVVHSSFHEGYPECDYDILIDPKMAFGTGHHSTTRLMVEALFSSDIAGKSLIDVGTGSAILAILASKLGAREVWGVEIDEAAYVNAKENISLNHCRNIETILGEIHAVEPDRKFDFLLANINRNIILDSLASYAAHITRDGQIFVSGFYDDDAQLILAEAQKHGLTQNYRKSDKDWTVIGLRKI